MILEEGQPTEDIHFISKGICQVSKNIKFVLAAGINNNYKYRQFTSESDLKPREQIVMKTLQIATLRQFDFFGEEDLLTLGRRQALSESFNSNTSKTTWTIRAEGKVECLTIAKIDFFRALTLAECDDISKHYARYPPLEKIVSTFLINSEWARYKEEVMNEIYARKRIAQTTK